MSTLTGKDLNLVKPALADDHKVTIGTDLPANFQKIDDEFTRHQAETTTAHGATANRTASKILLRDASGNAPANGLSFPATQVASADANTLDDYEEGTWTAGFICSTSGTITLSGTAKTGSYTKIGRQVTVTGVFVVDSVSSPVGDLAITGLPFTAAAGAQNRAGVSLYASGLAAGVAGLVARVQEGTSQIDIYKFAAGSTLSVAGDVVAGAYFAVSTTYFV